MIALIRQFYDAPRKLRITGVQGQNAYLCFDPARDLSREPVSLDIEVSAQKQSAYNRLSYNEMALQLFQLGFFNPELSDQALTALEMMDFKGRDELRRILVPDHDVDLLAVELIHDSRDTGAARADAGADRIEVPIHGIDGHLRAGAGLAGDGLDLNVAGGNLGDVQLKQALDQAGVRAGDDDLRAAGRAADLHDVDADQIALEIVLAADLLAGGEPGFGAVRALSETDGQIAGVVVHAQDGAGEDLMLLGREAVENHAALGLTDALDDDLLGGLGGDATEGLGLDILADEIADGAVRVDLPGGVQLDLGGGGHDLLHDFLLGVHPQIVLGELNVHVVGVAGAVLFIGCKQGLRDPVGHIVRGNAALALELAKSCKNLSVRIGGHFQILLFSHF